MTRAGWRRFLGTALAAAAATLGISVNAARIPSADDQAAVSATFSILRAFTGGGDGAYPAAALAQSTDGNLYGTTSGIPPSGPGSGSGTVFKISPAAAVTLVHAFTPCTDAASAPDAGLIPGFDGNLYGTSSTTCAGGSAFFKVTPAGAVTVLHTFTAATEGSGRVVLSRTNDGSFQGTATGGGSGGSGTALRVNASGLVTVLHAFTGGSDGATPTGGLLLGSDGTVYGTAELGGLFDAGMVFTMAPDGTRTTLRSLNGTGNGANPNALIAGIDGSLYGTARTGGASGKGTFFKITTGGTLTVLHTFAGGADGATPTPNSVIQATDGNFYGTTREGGAANQGVLYQITPAGVTAIVHAFAGGADGALPESGVIQANDGSLYGTTRLGGSGSGTVFRASVTGMPVLPTIGIVSTSTAAPMPMTPMQIKVTGIVPCTPVSIQFSNSSGFLVVDTAIRLTADGSVVAAVPVYIDKATSQFAQGVVSVTVIQGGRASAPVNVTIQNLPPLSTYGLPLGQITKTFLNFQAMLIASRINDLEAFDVTSPNAASAFSALFPLRDQLDATIEQRSDLDRIMANNALVITASFSDGTTTTFDRHSVELMDRINAIYLQQSASTFLPASSSLRSADRPDASFTAEDLKGVLEAIKHTDEVNDILKLFHADPKKDILDNALAVTKAGASLIALGSLAAVAAGFAAAPTAAAALTVAATLGILSVGNNVLHMGADYIAIRQVASSTNDPGLLAKFNEDIADRRRDLLIDSLHLGLAGSAEMAKAAGLLLRTTGFEGADGLVSMYDWLTDGSAKQASQIETDFARAEAAEAAKHTGQIGVAKGTIVMTSNLGANAPLQMLRLCPKDKGGTFSSFCVESLADSGGAATVYLPLGDSFTDYAHVDVAVRDPLSFITLSSQTLDFTSLRPAFPFAIPAIPVTCVDDDAGNPDGDDPDCDSFLRLAPIRSAGARRSQSAYLSTAPPFVAAAVCADAPSLALRSTTLNFAAVNNGGTLTTQTAAQNVALTQTGAGAVAWTAAADQPWVTISPSSGTGSAILSISINNTGNVLPATGTRQATLTISAPFSASTPTAAITLKLIASSATQAPFGSFDTPLDGAAGIAGSLPVTGWALDDLQVTGVRVLRDPVAGEPPGLVFIGNAVLVDGARPDIVTAFPASTSNTRAGWGYLLLTNFLPNIGNGTFKLYAIADDADGHSTTLGTKTITCANATATAPFGAIDTPAQGEIVTTASLVNFGWVLSPGSRRADPPHGGTVRVVIDGALGASPTGWVSRPDLSALFPVSSFSGVNNALGVAAIDTTVLANGLHTISWVVTDNQGSAAGVGSRYLTVANGSGLTLDAARVADARFSSLGGPAALTGRRGFDFSAPYRLYEPDGTGAIVIQSEELDRIELQLGAGADGYAPVAGQRHPLPIGSRIDPATGTFTWSPGVGFVGTYDLVLAGRHVRIVLNPKGSGRVGPQTVIDLADGQLIAGWAADLDAPVGTGVDAVHVWAYPADGRDPIFLGAADYGGARPDVAAVYGDRFLTSGYGLTIRGLVPGTYDLAVFAYSTVRGGFVPAKTVRVTVKR